MFWSPVYRFKERLTKSNVTASLSLFESSQNLLREVRDPVGKLLARVWAESRAPWTLKG
jgi:hypothetical protein